MGQKWGKIKLLQIDVQSKCRNIFVYMVHVSISYGVSRNNFEVRTFKIIMEKFYSTIYNKKNEEKMRKIKLLQIDVQLIFLWTIGTFFYQFRRSRNNFEVRTFKIIIEKFYSTIFKKKKIKFYSIFVQLQN